MRSAVGGSEDMLSLLVENVADYALFMLNPSGHITSWNKGAARIKGYSRDEIIGQHFSIFYPEEDVRAGKPEWELVVAADSGRFEDEGWRVRKDGTRFWANVVITALRDHTGTLRGFGKVTRDLSARREAELERLDRERNEAERLRAHAARLAELERAKTEFLNLASHELRGPLAVARGYVSLLLDGSISPQDFAHRAGIVAAKLGQIESLVQKMLETARLDYGRLSIAVTDVDLVGIVRQEVEQIKPLLDATHTLRLDIAPDIPAIKGDRDRLAAIVGNLLDNAAKYSPYGGLIEIKLTTSKKRVFVSVSDQGVGIELDDIPKLFTRFSRLHSSELANIGGTGLGLYLSREIARRHGGDIIVESRRKEGSRFTLSLPIKPGAIQALESRTA